MIRLCWQRSGWWWGRASNVGTQWLADEYKSNPETTTVQGKGQTASHLVVAVREVEAGNVHAGINQLAEALLGPAGRPEGANDLGLADRVLLGAGDILEADVCLGRARSAEKCCVTHAELGEGGGGGQRRRWSW